ncbi:MAG: NnrU family protein [Burkholderiaceae bacterium]|nr:NnrU family protein [Burkholderiaceae bacterium]
MSVLIIGLVAFLGLHLLRVVAEPWRLRQITKLGERRWKALYSVASIASFALLIWGFVLARASTPVIWVPPMPLHYVTAVLVLVSFVLIAAAYVPGTRIQSAIGHPMTAGIKTWAFAHLLSAGTLADILLFGSFMVWAIVVYAAARRRDRAAGLQRPRGMLARDALAAVVGLVAWAVFAARLHQWLIGVSPFGS